MMRERIFRLLLILCSLLTALPSFAQDLDVEKPDDAFAIWTDYVIRKDIGNWHVGGVFEYAVIDKGQGMKNNELLLRPVVGYNPLSWLRFQFQVDFIYSFYTGFTFRYLPDVIFAWKAADFKFAFRTRLNLSHHIATGKFSPTIRNRLKIDYTIPETPLGLHISAEPYWLDRFVKTRYIAGADFKINKNLTLTTDYMRYQYYDIGKPHQNILYLTLYIKL